MGNSQSATPECCPPNSVPSASAKLAGATEPAKGEIITLSDGERAYVARPQGEIKGCIVVFHDVFGFFSGRSHHICDDLAESGYLVILPDLYGWELDGVSDEHDLFS